MNPDIQEIVIPVLILIGIIPAAIAHAKGYNFLWFWLLGMFVFILALPIAITMRPNEKTLMRRAEAAAAARGDVRCPECREFIRGDARLCPHCRSALAQVAVAP